MGKLRLGAVQFLAQITRVTDNTRSHTWPCESSIARDCLCSGWGVLHADSAETGEVHPLLARTDKTERHESCSLGYQTHQVWELRMTPGRYLRRDLVSR